MYRSLNICGGRIWRVFPICFQKKCFSLQMAWHILMQGILQLWVWCCAKPFTAFGCYAVLGQVFWRFWMFGSMVGADGLVYLDARHSAALSLMWCQAIYSLWLLCCIGPGILEVLDAWQPGRCRWLGIYWCKAICRSESDVVPNHLQCLVVMLYWARYFGGCECLAAWLVQMAWHILMRGHLELFVWCGAKPFPTFGCYAVLSGVFWRLWVFGSLVDADGLAYLMQGYPQLWIYCGAKPITTFDWWPK